MSRFLFNGTEGEGASHRIFWKSRYDDNVAVVEEDSIEGKQLKGRWVCDLVGKYLILRGPGELRTYVVEEWLTKLSCRAVLVEVIDRTISFKLQDYEMG